MSALADRRTLHRMNTFRRIVTFAISLLYVAVVLWDRHIPVRHRLARARSDS
jgi:hypothetical protein